uniref:Uncharacterized protein n=1 Tax=Perkinsus marinus TaxID=31276 RepID=C9VXM0_9ALVE|nr:unknown protein [Perkinsus marinus]
MIKQTILSILLVCRATSGQDPSGPSNVPPLGSYLQYDPATGLDKDDLVVTVNSDEKGKRLITVYIAKNNDSKVDLQSIIYQTDNVPLKMTKSSGDLYSVDYSSPVAKSTLYPYGAIDFKLDYDSSKQRFILTHRPTHTKYTLVFRMVLSGEDHSKKLRGLAEPSSGGIKAKKYCGVGDHKGDTIRMYTEKGRLQAFFQNAVDSSIYGQVCEISVITNYALSGRYLFFDKFVNDTSVSAFIKVGFSIIKDETADSYAVTYNGDNENRVVFKRC